MSQSVWQPFSDRTPGSSESVGEAFARHSASAPSPFHLNLHFLSHTSSSPSRTNVDAVLQLSLRKMSEAYIRGGSEALPETGWTIVHGHGRTKQFGSEDDDDGSMHGDSRRGGYQRASHEEWRDARYREPPGADGLPTNSRARQVQSFLQRYFSPSGQGGRSASSTKSSSSCKFHALPGNQGTICVTRRQLILWMDASRGRSKVQ